MLPVPAGSRLGPSRRWWMAWLTGPWLYVGVTGPVCAIPQRAGCSRALPEWSQVSEAGTRGLWLQGAEGTDYASLRPHPWAQRTPRSAGVSETNNVAGVEAPTTE